MTKNDWAEFYAVYVLGINIAVACRMVALPLTRMFPLSGI
jgi:hypothetical protein